MNGLGLSLAALGLGIWVPSTLACRAKYRVSAVPLASPRKTGGTKADPANPYRPPLEGETGTAHPSWSRFRHSSRFPERTSRLGFALLVTGILNVPVFVWLAGHPPDAWIAPGLVQVGVFVGILVAFAWEEPALARKRDYARAVLGERGFAATRARDENFVGVAGARDGARIGNGSEDIGFLELRGSDLLLHLVVGGELRIPRAAVVRTARDTARGDTMGLYGVRLLRVDWTDAETGADRSLYLLAKKGQTAIEFGRSTNALAKRVDRWLASATS